MRNVCVSFVCVLRPDTRLPFSIAIVWNHRFAPHSPTVYASIIATVMIINSMRRAAAACVCVGKRPATSCWLCGLISQAFWQGSHRRVWLRLLGWRMRRFDPDDCTPLLNYWSWKSVQMLACHKLTLIYQRPPSLIIFCVRKSSTCKSIIHSDARDDHSHLPFRACFAFIALGFQPYRVRPFC